MATEALEPRPFPGGMDELIRISKSRHGKPKYSNVPLIHLAIPCNECGTESIGPWYTALSSFTDPGTYSTTVSTPISGNGRAIAGCPCTPACSPISITLL